MSQNLTRIGLVVYSGHGIHAHTKGITTKTEKPCPGCSREGSGSVPAYITAWTRLFSFCGRTPQ